MKTYQKVEWEELEGKTDLTPIEIRGNIYSIRYENIPLFLHYTFSATLQDFTNTYFITITGGRGFLVSHMEKTDERLEKIVKNKLPIIVQGYYHAPSCRIDIEKIKICGGSGRLSLSEGTGDLSVAGYGNLSVK
ncbi:MAG: hypothetical protein Q8R37_00310 [Nanoarchaeota archaeon]|nr:hypothetical protein [Nanoarchaeota archaeon]